MLEIELIVGTMGLRAIFGDKLPRYSKALLDRASTVLKSFETQAKSMAKQTSTGAMPSEEYDFKDYKELTKMLQDDQEVLNAAEGLASWPSDLQIELITQIADVKIYLAEQLPLQQSAGFLSSEFLECSDSDKFRFLWQANLCEDIRGFGDLFLAGAITPIESQLMRTLFPGAHDFFVTLVIDQVLDAAVTDRLADWEGGWQKPAISALLGIPIDTFGDVMGWQSGMNEKEAGRPKGAGSLQLARINQTENQAADFKTVDQSKL